MNFDYNSYFERKREVCGGELVVKGTRVTVRTLLASLAEGASLEEIRADYPTVSAEGLRAVVAFAAASAEEDLPVPPFAERYASYIGAVTDLPSDFAKNLDHYVHGH